MARKNPWYDPTKAHHTPEGFRNPEPAIRSPDALKRWRAERKAGHLPRPPQQGYRHFKQQWWQAADLSLPGDGMWWLGHASVLLRIKGRYILTDPIFSARASPLPFLGPVRKTPPALQIDQLVALDAVLISHNHYDHLDRYTIRQINHRFPETYFYVPLGLGRWMARQGCRYVVELDWWQDATHNNLTYTLVPARHWSMRTPWNRNHSLWGGWVVTSATLRFWFSGDSGVSPGLAEIARRLGPIHAAALPIGAFEPRWFMAQSHMDPQAAVALWQATGRPITLPIHWGTFELTDEALDRPPLELALVLQGAGEAPGERFRAHKIGTFILLN